MGAAPSRRHGRWTNPRRPPLTVRRGHVHQRLACRCRGLRQGVAGRRHPGVEVHERDEQRGKALLPTGRAGRAPGLGGGRTCFRAQRAGEKRRKLPYETKITTAAYVRTVRVQFVVWITLVTLQYDHKFFTGSKFDFERRTLILFFKTEFFYLNLCSKYFFPEPRAGTGAGAGRQTRSRSHSKLDRLHNTVCVEPRVLLSSCWSRACLFLCLSNRMKDHRLPII